MLKAVLFDFDQTVVNSSEGFRSAERWLQKEIFTFLQLVDWGPFIEVYRDFRGKGPADTPGQKSEIWRAVCRHFGTEPSDDMLLAWQKGYWGLIEEGTVLFAETLPVLKGLKEQFRLGLITNASSPEGKPHRLERFPGLKALFDALVICGGEDIPAKPATDGFQRMLSLLQLSADEVVYIGDNPVTDGQGARSSGVLPVLLRHRAINWNRPLVAAGEWVRIDSLEPLRTLTASDTLSTIQQKLSPGAVPPSGSP